MPTDTLRARTPAREALRAPALHFALRLIAWSLALFGVARLPWIGAHVLLPATRLEAAAGSVLLGPSSLPIDATLACSGADALALCLGAILAYPARWRLRAVGVFGGAAAILLLNTIRIGTLGRAAASPRWFEALHVYVWPALLTLAIGGLVLAWMRAADRRREPRSEQAAQVERVRSERASQPRDTTPAPDWRVTGRFALVAAVLLLLFTLAAPLYLESAGVRALAGVVARGAAFLLRAIGTDATASAGLLATPRGAFLVTQECISTPLIPVYFAAVLVYSPEWRTRALGLVAALPLFIGLGMARLLVVALPAGLDASPAFLIHAFSQLLVAAGMVCGLALWRSGVRASTLARTAAALAIGIVFVRWLGTPYTHAVLQLSSAPTAYSDAQGALLFLPAFQAGLFMALWVAAFIPSGWRRFLSGAMLLVATQVAFLGGVQWLAVHAGLTPLVRDIRAWALIGPALVMAAVVNLAQPRR